MKFISLLSLTLSLTAITVPALATPNKPATGNPQSESTAISGSSSNAISGSSSNAISGSSSNAISGSSSEVNADMTNVNINADMTEQNQTQIQGQVSNNTNTVSPTQITEVSTGDVNVSPTIVQGDSTSASNTSVNVSPASSLSTNSLSISNRGTYEFPRVSLPQSGNAQVGSVSCPTAALGASVFVQGQDSMGANYGGMVSFTQPLGVQTCRDSQKTQQQIMEAQLEALQLELSILKGQTGVIVETH